MARGRKEKRTKQGMREKPSDDCFSQRRLFSDPKKQKKHHPLSPPPPPKKKLEKTPADAHGETKVAYPWLAPTEPAKWKEEHTVFVVLGGWAIAISSAMKIFGGGKKEDKAAPAAVVAAPAK